MTRLTTYKKTTLPNGVRIVSELIPSALSVSIGIFVEVGSRDEEIGNTGLAHFLEHLAFKGTTSKTSHQITSIIESSGGSINAFTGREITGFYASVLPEELENAIDVLSDIISHSTFPEIELVKEREVILDELRGVLETPDDFIFEKWQEQFYRDHPLGRSILGTADSLNNVSRETILQFVSSHYQAQRIVVAAAGQLLHNELCDLIHRYLDVEYSSQKVDTISPNPIQSSQNTISYPSENAHLVIGSSAFAYSDSRKIPLLLLNSILGNGMSSRLFQEIREKKGIAYSVYSFTDSYRDCGLFGIYLGTDSKKVESAKSIALKELRKLVEIPLSDTELQKTKNQVRGNLVLALESTSSRMSRIARMELYQQDYLTVEELQQKIDQVTSSTLQEVATDLWAKEVFVETLLIPSNGKNNE